MADTVSCDISTPRLYKGWHVLVHGPYRARNKLTKLTNGDSGRSLALTPVQLPLHPTSHVDPSIQPSVHPPPPL
jgi:hypothetical protein